MEINESYTLYVCIMHMLLIRSYGAMWTSLLRRKAFLICLNLLIRHLAMHTKRKHKPSSEVVDTIFFPYLSRVVVGGGNTQNTPFAMEILTQVFPNFKKICWIVRLEMAFPYNNVIIMFVSDGILLSKLVTQNVRHMVKHGPENTGNSLI